MCMCVYERICKFVCVFVYRDLKKLEEWGNSAAGLSDGCELPGPRGTSSLKEQYAEPALQPETLPP